MRFKSVQYAGDPNDEEARFQHALKHQRQYSKWELMFDWDPFSRTLEQYSYDQTSGVMTVKRTQDARQTLDDNAEWRQSEQNWRKKEDKWLRYASIPFSVVEKWLIEDGINVLLAETDRNGVPNEHLRRTLKKLRDPEWQYLKTVDMDMGDGSTEGMTRLTHVPGNGLIWPCRDPI